RREADARPLELRLRRLRARGGGADRLLAVPLRPRPGPLPAAGTGARPMKDKRKVIIRGAVVVAALRHLLLPGASPAVVCFVPPSELRSAPVAGKAYRLGGMVKPGTVAWDPKTIDLRFTLSDGEASVPVRHKGSPPDLFAEGRGAVVEGTWTADGYFNAA